MARTHYVIIGDGIAGATAAGTIRDEDPEGDITVFTTEGEPLYNRVRIKDFAKGALDEESCRIHDQAWYDSRDIDLRLYTAVKRVDDRHGCVMTEDGERLEYDKLLLATGGRPRKYPAPNSRARGVHTFWTFEDARAIKDAAQEADSSLVIGAGLLGIDLAVILGTHGANPRYIMRGNRWWREGVSKEGSAIVERALEDLGVECVFQETVTEFHADDTNRLTGATTDQGDTFDCDMAGVAIGLNLGLRPVAGSTITRGEGVLCNENLQTSVPNIFAAGDVCQYYDVLLNRVNLNGSWASGKAQGKVAGYNMTRDDEEDFRVFEHVDFYAIDHFDFPVMSVGSVLGDASIDALVREDVYRRIIFKNERIIGGVMVGDATPLPFLKKAIANRVDVSDVRDHLLDPDFDWKKLLQL